MAAAVLVPAAPNAALAFTLGAPALTVLAGGNAGASPPSNEIQLLIGSNGGAEAEGLVVVVVVSRCSLQARANCNAHECVT